MNFSRPQGWQLKVENSYRGYSDILGNSQKGLVMNNTLKLHIRNIILFPLTNDSTRYSLKKYILRMVVWSLKSRDI